MNLLLPENIYTRIFLSELDNADDLQHSFIPSALIAEKLSRDNSLIGLIPTMDLLTHKDLFISNKIGLSFDGLLSNSFLFFEENQEDIKEFFLEGDVSVNEVILSKILFREMYEIEINPVLKKEIASPRKENSIVVGDENFSKDIFVNGLSFSEEIVELINAPYVNYILASASEELVAEFEKKHLEALKKGHPTNLDDFADNFSESATAFVLTNIHHLVFDFDEQDLEGIKLLLQLPYFHGIVKDMIELKFV